ncbi:MAG: tetratricopeptide repeat protein [Verrucomicrobiota bacterium]|nr:tetratricopeptide repeat protein [Verrucomicrobiota bacterium]
MAERSEQRAGIEMRLARLAVIRGEMKQAEQHFRDALAGLLESPKPPRETVAWCRWQLGETAFSVGDYETAERYYEDALTTAPGYFRALASLGRLLAARGDLPGAIARYEEAVRITPAPAFVGALGDLYQLSGMIGDAQARFEMVEQLGEHSRKVHGSAFNRPLALFHADHGIQTEEAYQLARSEYDAGRHDVYGADAVAWTALKSGHLPEAQAAMKAALRLGTRDARLFYHAAMIAKASGERAASADFLHRALELNPGFDPLQRQLAQNALED